jgi:hypothetical protein
MDNGVHKKWEKKGKTAYHALIKDFFAYQKSLAIKGQFRSLDSSGKRK